MDNDTNPYVRYRAAFALAEHGIEKYKDRVLEVLKEAADDKDIGSIAREYLKKLK
jgi:HEAT repeat protein